MMKVIRSTVRTVLLGVAVFLLAPASSWAARPVSLEGYWSFEMDPADAGEHQQWFNRNLRNGIRLPGILQQSQFYGGDNITTQITTRTPWVLTLYDRFWYLRDDYKAYLEPGKVKVPFLSQPPRHYLGAAWYQRDIHISPQFLGRRILLILERPHWETTVWIDGQKMGSNKSLVAPHVYDISAASPGRHRLTVRVDNRMVMPYRPDAHSVSDSLGASWNGITGRIELSDTGRIWIEDAQAFPNLEQKSMLIKVRIGNNTGRSGAGTLTAIWPDIGVVPVTWDEFGGTAEVEVPLRFDAPTWDEFYPKLQLLRLWLRGTGVDEYSELKIGLRDFRAEGKEFRLNGKPIIFRGTHNGGDFPLTGYPPTDVASWRKLFETCRKWGLNHMRFHSWCPPEAAFEAADELGFYLQPEPGMWNEISPGTPMERMLYEETDRMIKAYGNHPSFMLLSASHEPQGKWKEALSKWVEHYRKRDSRRLYTSGTGHTEREVENLTEATDYLALHRVGSKMLRRESGWFGGDYEQSLVDVNLPVVAHEVGQWAAYPDYEIIKKFKGYLRPGNFEIFHDSMKEHRLLEKNRAFTHASGQFQVACYKEEIEANLRTPGLGGFQLLDLHDYLGRGTAPVGLLDAFWEPKSYVSPEGFKRFCNSTVPLARLRQRVFTTADAFNVDVELAHYGAEPIENALAVWKITGDDEVVPQGEWEARTIPIGKNIPLGKISFDLSKLPAPREYTLVVTVAPASFFSAVNRKIVPGPNVIRGVTYFENHWNFWLYPPSGELGPSVECPPSLQAEVLTTRSWEEAEKKLAAGGRVLFVPRNSDLDWTSPPLDSVPIFWNRLTNPAWGRMLGLWIHRPLGESKSHTLDGFPTSTNFDWQWAQIIHNVRAVNLDRLPVELEPVVWAIDDWNRNYKLGVIFEGAVGDGRLLVSAFDVTNPTESNPVAKQLRNALLRYAKSDCFQPNVPLRPEQMRGLFFDTRIMKKLGAAAEVEGASANNLIDGDPNTFVLAGDRLAETREQVDIMIRFRAPVAMAGVVLMPRQSHREHEGDIRAYAVQVSDDGSDWRDVARGELLSTFAPQQIEFSRPVTARYLKFISLSGFGPDKTTALAELAVMYAGPKLAE
ncbi:MAG: discoidin domain-containing protein [Pyrinomonadaceae bacterium]|nr:discoidin domain-containing protein [Pyrinomonadaceae bacterium]